MMLKNVLVQDLRWASLRCRCRGPLHYLGWPGHPVLGAIRMSRRVLSGSLANRETTDASSDDVPSPRKWVVSASETRPVHDTFGLSRIYLPGPGPQSKESEVDDKEDGIPDADVAVDDEGNAAQKALMITRVPEGATLEDLTQLLGGFGECVVFMRASTSLDVMFQC